MELKHCVDPKAYIEVLAAALEAWGADLKGPRQREALAEMDAEIDNARAEWG